MPSLSHIPKMPKGLFILPYAGLLLSLVVLGFSISGLASAQSTNATIAATSYAVVVSLISITALLYIIIAENLLPSVYNYYVVLAFTLKICLISILGGILAGVVTVQYPPPEALATTLRGITVHLGLNGLLSLVYEIMLAIAVRKHRKAGGHSKYKPEHLHSPMELLPANGKSQNQTQSNVAELAQPAQEVAEESIRSSVHYKGSDPYHPLRLNPPASDSGTVVSKAMRKIRRRGMAYELQLCRCREGESQDGILGRPVCHLCAPEMTTDNSTDFQVHDTHGET